MTACLKIPHEHENATEIIAGNEVYGMKIVTLKENITVTFFHFIFM